MDRPQPVLARLDALDSNLGEDLGAVVPGVLQVGDGDRVLGPVVAAGHAVATQLAGRLLDAKGVGLILEADVDRDPDEGLTHGLRRASVGLELVERGPVVGVGSRRQHLAGAGVALGESGWAIGDQLGGPAGVAKHGLVGFEGDVGVDQRGSAEAAAREDREVALDVPVEQAEGIADSTLGVARDRGLALARALELRVRELAGHEFAPALEQADLLAGP